MYYHNFSQTGSTKAAGGFSGPNGENATGQSLYPSTKDLKGLAFSSGAITISKETSPKRTLGGKVPSIDRSSKPELLSNTLDVELMNAKNNAFSSGVEMSSKGHERSLNLLNETLNSTRLGVDTPTTGNSILDNTIQESVYGSNNSMRRYFMSNSFLKETKMRYIDAGLG